LTVPVSLPAGSAPRPWHSLGLLLLCLAGCAPKAPPPPRPVSVTTAPVQTASFSEGVDTVGTLEALEEVALATRVAGRIERLLVREGQRVQAGQLLLELDQSQPRAQLASAREGRDNLCIDYKRFEFLAARGAASALQRDSLRARCLQAREDVKAREADLAFSNLRAPITGVISDLEVKPGDIVQAGSPFTKVIRNDRLALRLEIPAVHSPRVRPGQPVRVQPPSAGAAPIEARIDFVDPNITTTTQALLVKAEIPNSDGALRTGLRLQARLQLQQRSLPAVPFAAVTQTAGQSFVYRIGTLQDLEAQPGQAPLPKLRQLPAGSRFALQVPVRLGPLQQNRYAVLQGVAPGATVITSNLLNLRHGTPVSVGPPAAAPTRRP
jgi:RND family efflux transporter MFP subunit